MHKNFIWDVVVVGGGPGGLSAALALGRARKHVLVCDSGPRRNAAAEEVHNFVTRDGTPPDEFRRIGREQLARYPNVSVRDERIASITGERGAFHVALPSGVVVARRVLLSTGLVDEVPRIEGFSERWGHSVIQCPYCHGWELQGRPWAYFAREADLGHVVPFVTQLRGWTRDVTVFTNGAELPAEVREPLERAAIRVETAAVLRLSGPGTRLERVELVNGTSVACEALFAHPPQHQVELVKALGVALEEDGMVRIDPLRRETSVPGVYAAGDSTTRLQAAVVAAAAGMHAAAMINLELTMELVAKGEL